MMTVGTQSFGQFGEDEKLAATFRGQDNRTCVDVGANDGTTGSLSLKFERLGWKCVLVEPNPDLCARLRTERRSFVFQGAASDATGIATLKLAEGGDLSHAVSSIAPDAERSIHRLGYRTRDVEVPTAPLDDILEMAEVQPGEIAFVSIDVEGHEAEVLKGFTLSRWQPEILLIEDNSLIFGNGVRQNLAEQGYTRFRRTGVNDWYASPAILAQVSARPQLDYFVTMISSRALMIRRSLVERLCRIPIFGRMIRSSVRAIRPQY